MPTQTLARDIMTKTVIRVNDDWTVNELARFLTDRGISGAPVVNGEGRLVGVVSLTDIARATGDGHAALGNQSLYQPELNLSLDDVRGFSIQSSSELTVRQIMTPLVFEVGADGSWPHPPRLRGGRGHRGRRGERSRSAAVARQPQLIRRSPATSPQATSVTTREVRRRQRCNRRSRRPGLRGHRSFW